MCGARNSAANCCRVSWGCKSEYRKHIEKDAALERRFQPVMVEQPSVEETISILRGLKHRYEIYHGVHIQDSALVAAATLSHRHITDRFLPDKAIDLIDFLLLCATAAAQEERERSRGIQAPEACLPLQPRSRASRP